MLGEVAAHSREEVFAADISLQLLEHGCALGVGNAIEVLLHGFNIGGIRGNRVRGRKLILLVSPGLLHVGKVTHAVSYWVFSACEIAADQVAKDSFSHRSSHHCMVTKSPNHMWASSCRIVSARRSYK